MDNQQPSLEQRKVQRLSLSGVGQQAIGGSKWQASFSDEDIVYALGESQRRLTRRRCSDLILLNLSSITTLSFLTIPNDNFTIVLGKIERSDGLSNSLLITILYKIYSIREADLDVGMLITSVTISDLKASEEKAKKKTS